jgi:hypothetical protein
VASGGHKTMDGSGRYPVSGARAQAMSKKRRVYKPRIVGDKRQRFINH